MRWILLVLSLAVCACTETEWPEDADWFDFDAGVDTETDMEAISPVNMGMFNPSTDTDYPPGPYGFKGSIYWDDAHETGIAVKGDTIPNICLNNFEDNEECLSQFFHGEYQLVFVDFSASWCYYCNVAANNEKAFLSLLKDKGWDATWITVLNGDGLDEAVAWKSEHDLSGSVLYNPIFMEDDELKTLYDTWSSDVWATDEGRGYPTFFVVYTDNMIIWDVEVGWSSDPSALPFIVDDIASKLDLLSQDDRLTAPVNF
jgi:hypothetical protein